MKLILVSLCVPLAAALFGPVHAAPISNGAASVVIVRDCRSPGAIAAGSTTPDMCSQSAGFFGTIREQAIASRPGALTASAIATSSLAIIGGDASRSSVAHDPYRAHHAPANL